MVPWTRSRRCRRIPGAKLLALLKFEPFDRARQLLRMEKLRSDFPCFRKRYYEAIWSPLNRTANSCSSCAIDCSLWSPSKSPTFIVSLPGPTVDDYFQYITLICRSKSHLYARRRLENG